MFSMSLLKEFQLLKILNDLSIRLLITLILNENDVNLLNLKRSPVQVDGFKLSYLLNFLIFTSTSLQNP